MGNGGGGGEARARGKGAAVHAVRPGANEEASAHIHPMRPIRRRDTQVAQVPPVFALVQLAASSYVQPGGVGTTETRLRVLKPE